MIEKLFGATEEEQYRYLKPRLIATAVSLILVIDGVLLYFLLDLEFAKVIGGVGALLFPVMMLIFGWSIMRGLFGIASLGVLFSGNVVLAAVILIAYLFLGYYGGMVAAVIGLCRFLVILKHRK